MILTGLVLLERDGGSIRQICYTCKVYGGPQVVAIVRITKDRNCVICDHGNNLEGAVTITRAMTR